MKLSKKGFTLVELLAVIVILVVIMLIAIPSITASLSRSREQENDARKQLIVSSVEINLKKNDFNSYDTFRNGSCDLTIDKLISLGYITESDAKDSDNVTMAGCVGYVSGELAYKDSCSTTCSMKR